jgi:excisionase family DNA binding protein
MLGVHPSTLREWTRAGRLEAVLTPGGHRRYRASDLQAFPDGDRSASAASSLASCLLACQRRCGLVDARALEDRASEAQASEACAWLAHCDEATHQRLRLLGASLLHLLTTYLLASHNADGDRCLARAREDAAEYGVLTVQLGFPPSAAIEAFTRCRAPILQALHQWAERPRASGSSPRWALDRVHRFLDQALVSMVAAHEVAAHDRSA